MNNTTLSEASAVVLIAQWIVTHDGRPPSSLECTKANGLPHRVTLQYVCGGVTHAVSLALALLATSGTWVSATPCSARMTQCLRCDMPIVWEGPQIQIGRAHV